MDFHLKTSKSRNKGVRNVFAGDGVHGAMRALGTDTISFSALLAGESAWRLLSLFSSSINRICRDTRSSAVGAGWESA